MLASLASSLVVPRLAILAAFGSSMVGGGLEGVAGLSVQGGTKGGEPFAGSRGQRETKQGTYSYIKSVTGNINNKEGYGGYGRIFTSYNIYWASGIHFVFCHQGRGARRDKRIQAGATL